MTCKDISDESKKDSILSQVMKCIIDSRSTNSYGPKSKCYETKKSQLTIHDGCVIWGIRACHSFKFKGTIFETHLGIIKMKALGKEHVWWSNIDKSNEDISNRCSLFKLYAAREPHK